ncbi:UNVERIFIED_CONTAM: hypothetical protein PYX00_004741 [Menopon gallinae]|uniref:mitogen-activated protein kinase n=1 Tax=Menopon gallinae TaxID=328185 RepID=A0AAW2I6Q4_9NEOP
MSEKKEKAEKKERTNDVDEQISKRYEMKKRLGKGAYGIVWKAFDKKTKETVAVKKIFDAFRNQTDAQRTFREIMFLQAFRDHPNIIRLRGLHKASNNKDIYLVFDYMDTDLHHVIKKGNILKDIHRRYIMYQLLRATRYLHSGNVIHRDQKPSNVLINAECRIKLADFGLARSLANHYGEEDTEGPPMLTDYVATRWYRAPEILVASKRYTKGVDMWSLGCILGEMLLGKPLFPGSSTVNQIERIMSALPEPTAEEINNMCCGYGKGLLENAAAPKTTLREMIKTSSDDAMDLVTKLLVFDPTKRLTASQALAHQYVSKFCNGSEVCLDHSIIPPLNDDIQLSVSEYRNKLYELIANAKHHPKSYTPRAAKASSTSSSQKESKRNKSSPAEDAGRSNFTEITHKKLSKYVEASVGDGLKENLHKSSTKYKNYSVEELREKSTNSRVMATKSEPSQKTESSYKRSSSSPQHRNQVPQAGKLEWARQKQLGGLRSKPSSYIRQRLEKPSRSAECGDGCNLVKPFQNLTSSGGCHINSCSLHQSRNSIAEHIQTQEKLRQNYKMNRPSALPRAVQKKDYLKQNSESSSPSLSSYNHAHGIITSSAIHDIRAVLKH